MHQPEGDDGITGQPLVLAGETRQQQRFKMEQYHLDALMLARERQRTSGERKCVRAMLESWADALEGDVLNASGLYELGWAEQQPPYRHAIELHTVVEKLFAAHGKEPVILPIKEFSPTAKELIVSSAAS